jgi:hypothetical protein
MGDSRIKDVSSLLSSFFDEGKLRQGEKYSGFFSSWPALVGSRLAAHSRVVDIEKGLLVVEAEHPGWLQLLQIRQSGILSEATRRYPELGLRGIVFRLSGQGRARVAGARQSERGILEEDAATASDMDEPPKTEGPTGKTAADDINDPEFHKLFSSLKKAMQGKG